MKINYEDSRLVEAASRVPNVCGLDNKPQLLTSNYERHIKSYTAFAEIAELNKQNLRCLVVGLGNLSETVGYVASYYDKKKTLEGLEITVIDLVEKSFFEEMVSNPETFRLGKNDEDLPIKPLIGQESAFVFDEELGEYVLGKELGEFVQGVVEKGYFGVNIQNIDQAGLPEENYDFVSCQNVLGYVLDKDEKRDRILSRIVSKMAEGGVLAVKTDTCDRGIAASIEKQDLPLVYWKDGEYIDGLYEKPRRLGGRKVKNFFDWESEEGKRIIADTPKKSNVFGV